MASPGFPEAGQEQDEAAADASASSGEAGPCSNCRGRGWKFLGLRRSEGAIGDAGEVALLRRARTGCLACGGTGRAA